MKPEEHDSSAPTLANKLRRACARGGARATLSKDPHEVARMFDEVGQGYDVTNKVLSAGRDAAWRRATRDRLKPRVGEKILDVAAGTAVSTVSLAEGGAWVVACDFSQGMLAAGRHRHVDKVAADGLHLPFADNTFDAVSISFGLRNFVDYRAGLKELARVTRPGGRLAVTEFSTPTFAPFAAVYKAYLMRALPAVARVVSSDPEAYEYLAESIRAWPNQEHLAGVINHAGWTDCGWIDLTGGIVAIHSATKPEA